MANTTRHKTEDKSTSQANKKVLSTVIFDKLGKKSGNIALRPEIFSIKPNFCLIKQSVISEQVNKRQANAHTKLRGEVSGGGKKPWRQKGTGRARAGSIRSPLWSGGGITFGPRNSKNYKQKLPLKMKRKAIYMILSDLYASNRLIIVNDFTLEKPKTKQFVELLNHLPTQGGSALILSNNNLPLELSARNVPYVKIINLNNLNILDLINYDYLLTTKKNIELLQSIFIGNKE